MTRGTERVEVISRALEASNLDALVCTLPTNVLLLSGYWPVVGTAIAAATRDGRIAVLAPQDEQDLAQTGWAQTVRTYAPGSLTSLGSPSEAARQPLGALLRDLGVDSARISYDVGDAYQESTYAATYLFRSTIQDLLQVAAPGATLTAAAATLTELRSALTPDEVGRVRLACALAGPAFGSMTRNLCPGLHEPDVATRLESLITVAALAHPGVGRAGAFVWCMSGQDSALAGRAYARTRNRELRLGDFVLVHCNSYIDGYWTDITRTYCLGEPDQRKQAMYEAVFAARESALRAIRPGAKAADVDKAARDELTQRGFGQYFTHGVGHNVGFSAISAEYPPRLHPASPDVLETGMTFNIEPAIYIEGYGGLRHCDVVTVHENGPEVLTPFQARIEDLVV